MYINFSIKPLASLEILSHKTNPFSNSYVNTWKKEHEDHATDKIAYLSNPLNVYHLFKKLTADWQQITEKAKENNAQGTYIHFGTFLVSLTVTRRFNEHTFSRIHRQVVS